MRDYGTTNNTPAHQAPPVWRAPEGLEDLTAAQVGDGGACQHTNDKPDRLEAAARPAGPGRGAGGRRQGLTGLRDDAPSAARGADGEQAGRRPPAHTAARPNKTGHAAAGHRADAPSTISREGPTGVEDTGGPAAVPVGDGGAAPPVWRTPEGTAAVPVGGGRAWPGFETTRRAQLAARTASGRAAAHRHTQRPGPTKQATRRQGLAGLREDTPSQSSAHPAPLVWRTPEGTAAVPVGDGGAAPPVWRTPEGTAAVPVGGGRAWPGFEIDHSERSSRVAISRAGRRPPAPTRRHKHSATNT